VIANVKLVWLVPVLITVHNCEEALAMPTVLASRNSAIPRFLHGLLPAITYRQFLLALLIVTAVPYGIAWFARRDRDGSGAGMILLLSVQVMMLINVFAHLWMATLIRGYAPGLLTALALILPFSIYFLHHAAKERWVSRKAWCFILPTGLLLHAIALPLILILCGKIVNGIS
jgi:hypothetical protein